MWRTARLAAFAVTAAALQLLHASGASAGTVSFKLDCYLNTTPCTPAGTSYGTLTLADVVGGIQVTVDLAGTGHKFRDLMLNYSSPVPITDNDSSNNIAMVGNGYSIQPYNGLFDVGGSGGKGWNGADLYSVILQGTSTALVLDNFKVRDSVSGVYAGIHIQNIGSATGGDCDGSGNKPTCVPGRTGDGSLKIGASSIVTVPDGGSALLMLGSVLTGIGLLARRR
ncbi:MAG TPA: hypothetical protein VMF13_19115 [Luteitalea sp.]|nr:hypothetical protein [Luteitalea sp.]